VLAWRLLHEPRLAHLPAALAPFVPRPSGAFDRDPVAMLLAALAVALAGAYLAAALSGVRPRVRAALLASAALVLVVLPTLAFIGMGAATGRPYGQDGGVVQLPLALDRLLAGRSPYGADYSDSMLGKQARASDFWAP
jgi:drug/metabolite transporter superfamily protein YnfA